MAPITAFIFTRNRPSQLRLLLQSLERNLPGVFDPYVVRRSDSDDFRKGYARVMSIHSYGSWFDEGDSKRDEMYRAAAWAESRSGLMALFTDDCVAWRKADVTAGDIAAVMGDPKVVTASLRLGRNTTTQNYLTNEQQPALDTADPTPVTPDPTRGEGWLAWEYMRFPYYLNYGYIAGMDGHVFRARDMVDWLDAMPGMTTYRDWEGCLHLPDRRRQMAAKRPRMACPARSCVVNIPCNSVQVDPTASGQQFSYSVEGLNEAFLGGYEIDLDAIPFGDVRGCHQEFPLSLRKSA